LSHPPHRPFPTRRSSDLASAAAQPPAPKAPIPRDPSALATAIIRVNADLWPAIDAWRATRGPVPHDLTLDALYLQRIYRLLSARSEEHTSELQSLAYLVC